MVVLQLNKTAMFTENAAENTMAYVILNLAARP